MKVFKPILIILVLLLVSIGCQPKENNSQESHAEFLQQGDLITKQAQQALGSELKKAIQQGGPAYAVEFCNMAALEILDTMRAGENYTIRRIALRTRNPINDPTDEEREILLSYKQMIERGERPEPEVHDLSDGQLLYTKPILLDNPICLNCHGSPNQQINEATYSKIQELYPNDEATDFEIGDLRGMWSVETVR